MKNITTLIIEDDPMVLEVNRQYIEAVAGFEIIGLAENSKEGIEIIEVKKPQLTILDIYLPDKDGLSTLEEIRQRKMATDVIMVTAARDVDTIKAVFRYGAVDYIVKPFKFERIKSALESYLRMYQSLHSKSTLDQEEIDKLTKGAVNSEGDELPKGLTEYTLKQILLFLSKASKAYSAEEVAEGVGLARVTARRYLEFLVENDRVKLEQQYGSVGRPVNKYSLFHA